MERGQEEERLRKEREAKKRKGHPKAENCQKGAHPPGIIPGGSPALGIQRGKQQPGSFDLLQ